MPTLTYPYLGPDAADLIGQTLGPNPAGPPWRAAAVQHTDCAECRHRDDLCLMAVQLGTFKCCPDCTHRTAVTVEPWPLTDPAALAHADAAVHIGRHAEIPHRRTTDPERTT